MTKKTEKNPLGAGRKPNPWKMIRLSVPQPIHAEIKETVNKWIKENK